MSLDSDVIVSTAAGCARTLSSGRVAASVVASGATSTSACWRHRRRQA